MDVSGSSSNINSSLRFANITPISKPGTSKSNAKVSMTSSSPLSQNLSLNPNFNKEGEASVMSSSLLSQNSRSNHSSNREENGSMMSASTPLKSPSLNQNTNKEDESVNFFSDQRNELRASLVRSLEGRKILAAFDSSGKQMTKENRKRLVHFIIDRELASDLSKIISEETFETLVKSICVLFPDEEPGVYFRPYSNINGVKSKATGLLWDRAATVRRNLIKEGIIKSRKRTKILSGEFVVSKP